MHFRYKRIFFLLLIPLGYGLMQITSLSPDWVEKWYSQGIYPVLAQGISNVTGLFPFSVAQVILYALVIAAVAAVVGGTVSHAQYRDDAAYSSLYDSETVTAFKDEVGFISSAALEGRSPGSEGEKAAFCKKITGDMVAVVGENRKLLVFKLEEIPSMARGRGVALQKYQAGGKLSDIQIFKEEDGFCYNRSGGVANEKELLTWLGHRAQVGRLVPFGFPKSNKFFKD